MSLDRAVLMFAGFVILVSVLLSQFVHTGWIWLTVFPAAVVFRKLGLAPGIAFK